MKPDSLLKFSSCSWNSIAFFTIWSMYVFVLLSLCVFSNCISCPVFSRCYATADFSVWPWCRCLTCFWHLISMVLEVWPTYTLPDSYGMQYTPDVLRSRLSLISLKVLEVLFPWNIDSFTVMFIQQCAYFVRCEVFIWKQGNSHMLFRGYKWLVPGT
jgi:hypothetical protein